MQAALSTVQSTGAAAAAVTKWLTPPNSAAQNGLLTTSCYSAEMLRMNLSHTLSTVPPLNEILNVDLTLLFLNNSLQHKIEKKLIKRINKCYGTTQAKYKLYLHRDLLHEGQWRERRALGLGPVMYIKLQLT